MKKRMAFLLALLFLLAAAGGCQSDRTPINAAEFQAKAEAAGLLVVDAIEQVPEGAVEAYLIAVAGIDAIEYQIEFIVMPSVEEAIDAYQQNYTVFEAKKGSVSSYTSMNMRNFSYYKLSTNGMYYVISRIDNTFIYIDADDAYKGAINDFLKAIGY
ncbi:MAG: hypothetical protein FWF10_08910 [Clostridiales bacterium]|nr:hypothetical protein [Clostridiales bacterium]